MSKLKQPVISLEAHGTLANSLTFKRRRGKDLVVRKPIPTYRRTLPQVYQRWDYQDGIAYWNTLTPAQKQTYQSGGARHHMTGFAYFMSYYLSNLPDLAGRWRLDERSGGIAYDSSKNTNHGTIFGALHVPGYIDYGLFFDNTDDYVNCGSDPSLNVVDEVSLLARIKQTAPDPVGTIISRYWYQPFSFHTRNTFLAQRYYLTNDNNEFIISALAPTFGEWQAIALTQKYSTGDIHFYLEDQHQQKAATFTGQPENRPYPITIGSAQIAAGDIFHGILDDVIFLKRIISQQDFNRYKERRYP